MAKEHILKTHPQYFNDILSGKKNFELRKDDRGFQVGDTLKLEEFDPEPNKGKGAYLGRSILVVVTYKLTGINFGYGLHEDFCILGIIKKSEEQFKEFDILKGGGYYWVVVKTGEGLRVTEIENLFKYKKGMLTLMDTYPIARDHFEKSSLNEYLKQ